VGQKVAIQEMEQKKTIFALCRRVPPAPIKHLNINLDDPDLGHTTALEQLANTSFSLYYFAPPPPKGTSDPRITQFLTTLPAKPNKIVLISTTGVYGDCQGNWVSETTPTNPIVDRAKRRLDAENSLIKWSNENQLPYVILRVAGIYGKGKLPIERLKKQTPVLDLSDSPWSNRIYSDDLVNICCLVMNINNVKINNQIINVTDGCPSTMTDYFNQVADFLNLPRPPQISLQQAKKTLSKGMLSYLNESKRIKPTKMSKLLDYNIRYPDLNEALRHDL
jgi:nucleoside-diphosphate-sugar epimerase